MTILVTGGAGFIGSNFILDWLSQSDEPVVNLDKLTYAANGNSALPARHGHHFVRGDICDRDVVSSLLEIHRPRAIVNFAAESHVDRSIAGPSPFMQTNLMGTFELLDAARRYWMDSDLGDDGFRFLHVSTDEVYGSLGPDDAPVAEGHPYSPNNPYSASKAGSDHLARAYHRTYRLPVLITNCSNNYGPRQHPEKLIPSTICNALAGRPLGVYGKGENIRDWLYVSDHCTAIRAVLERGRCGETYNIGAASEARNIDLVRQICALLDELAPSPHTARHADLIRFVEDRPGHDFRYALATDKIRTEIGWQPAESFETGLRKTVRWYLDNQDWVTAAMSGGSAGDTQA